MNAVTQHPARMATKRGGSQETLTHPLMLVSGGTGFVGRATLAALDRRGAASVRLDRARSDETLHRVLASIPRARREQAVMVHLAGLADPRSAQEQPERVLDEIVGLTARTVEACLRYGLAKCVLVSSGMVYGRQTVQPVTEEALPNPQGAYAGAKAAAEMLAQGRVSGERLALEIVRVANVIGPGMGRRTIVWELLTQLRRRREPVIVQSLHPRRDYIHVSDVAEALIAVARLPALLGTTRRFNAGTGMGTSVLELYHYLCAVMGRAPTEPQESGQADVRAFDIVLDARRLQAQTGWKPTIALREALRELVDGA